MTSPSTASSPPQRLSLVRCPKCGSSRVRRSRRRTSVDHALARLGAHIRRCHDCRTRRAWFGVHPLPLSDANSALAKLTQFESDRWWPLGLSCGGMVDDFTDQGRRGLRNNTALPSVATREPQDATMILRVVVKPWLTPDAGPRDGYVPVGDVHSGDVDPGAVPPNGRLSGKFVSGHLPGRSWAARTEVRRAAASRTASLVLHASLVAVLLVPHVPPLARSGAPFRRFRPVGSAHRTSGPADRASLGSPGPVPASRPCPRHRPPSSRQVAERRLCPRWLSSSGGRVRPNSSPFPRPKLKCLCSPPQSRSGRRRRSRSPLLGTCLGWLRRRSAQATFTSFRSRRPRPRGPPRQRPDPPPDLARLGLVQPANPALSSWTTLRGAPNPKSRARLRLAPLATRPNPCRTGQSTQETSWMAHLPRPRWHLPEP